MDFDFQMDLRQRTFFFNCAILFLTGAASISSAAEPTRDGSEFFEKKIRPVLTDRCYACHSADAKKIKGGFLLDSRAGLLKGGDTGPAIIPGDIEKSLLIKAVRYTDADLQMPPKKQLTPEQIADLEAWVKMGAPDPRTNATVQVTNKYQTTTNHWSFFPVKDLRPPSVKNKSWVKSPVDSFILAKIEAKNLSPAPPADKRTLIRRATFDLTGLPPTPKEVDDFLADKSAKAFEKVVNRLLASPAYGERWGRHWLDVARYADTSGCNSDYPVPSAYKYRNYVINSFNADKPYDEFLREQIAGDLLPAKNDADHYENVIATGYLAISRRFGSRNAEFHLTIEDTIDSLGKGILGLSTGCARCHDHKFDPIPTKDYYALYGIFSSTRYAFPGTEIFKHPKDFTLLVSTEQNDDIRRREGEIENLDNEIESLDGEKMKLTRTMLRTDPENTVTNELDAQLIEVKAKLEDDRTKLRKLENRMPQVEKAYAVVDAKPADVKIQRKGNPNDLGEKVPRGFLQVLGGQTLGTNTTGSGRLELAKWLTDPKNPLTARVFVNRIWEHHFGRGIVKTPNDFGTRGEAPTHPELLDFLAARFVEGGWSIKKMHRLIMLSSAYQMSCMENPQTTTIDPNNDLYFHFNRRRLDAEEVRDAILATSGALDRKMPAAHPFAPEKDWRYTQHTPFVAVYESNHRSIYLMQQRFRKHPFLSMFDGADTNVTTDNRPQSNTPLQALWMMNDPFVHEQADKFAVRVGMVFRNDPQRIDYAYKLSLGRPATSEEIKTSAEYLTECRKEINIAGLPFDEQARATLASFMRVIFSSNEFIYVD